MNTILYINLCLTVLGLLSFLFVRLGSRFPHVISPRTFNQLLRFFIVLVLVLPFLSNISPKEEIKIVSSSVEHSSYNVQAISQKKVFKANKREMTKESPFSLNLLFILWLAISLLFLFKVLKAYQATLKLIKDSEFMDNDREIEIYCSLEASVPFAFRGFTKKYVIVPYYLLENQAALTSAIQHEIQHHRNHDTSWVHILKFLKIMFFWNPFVWLFERYSEELQELSCDEVLVCRNKVSLREYTSCLFEVAQQTLNLKAIPAGTTGMAMSSSGKKLKRRILNMERYQVKQSKMNWLVVIVAFISFTSMTSYASNALLGRTKINLIEAQELAKKTSQETTFPIEINEEILEQLNKYIGTAEGRKFIKDSLKRKKKYQAILSSQFENFKAPKELLAVALMESGFRNLPQRYNRMKSAGVWQFIPSTARNYGLRVDNEVDERLNVSKETNAALSLLGALNLRFKDWRLAVMAYNAGETKVQRGINHLGTRDAWKLIDGGYTGDENYLAKVMAGVLILNNPELID